MQNKAGDSGNCSSAGIRVNESILFSLFTCPGCGVPANKPPLFQCIKGHVSCARCAVSFKGTCPKCRQRMTTERNIWMENAVTCVTFPLPNERNGTAGSP